jgi:hypothetical protein
MKKQTAVEWLEVQIGNFLTSKNLMTNIDKLISQAKEMEKQQIEDAFEESRLVNPMVGMKHRKFKDYYNETFKSE